MDAAMFMELPSFFGKPSHTSGMGEIGEEVRKSCEAQNDGMRRLLKLASKPLSRPLSLPPGDAVLFFAALC